MHFWGLGRRGANGEPKETQRAIQREMHGTTPGEPIQNKGSKSRQEGGANSEPQGQARGRARRAKRWLARFPRGSEVTPKGAQEWARNGFELGPKYPKIGQIGATMEPTWSQGGPKMVTGWPPDGPHMPKSCELQGQAERIAGVVTNAIKGTLFRNFGAQTAEVRPRWRRIGGEMRPREFEFEAKMEARLAKPDRS